MIHTFTRPLTLVILWLLTAQTGYAADKFTIAILPDTQNYVDDDKEIRHFKKQMQWIVDNRVNRNIVFVTHVGDIVQNGGSAVEWQRTIAAMSILEKGAPELPYGMVLGNHDTDPTYNANGSAANYVKHFGATRFAGKSWYGGADADQRNHYQVFSAGGRRFLNLSLERRACSKDNSDFAGVTAWAQGVLDDHPKSPTIITTHEYTEPGGRRNRFGDDIYKALVAKNSQVFMVICGHRPGEGHQTVKNAAGQDVFELLADHQSRPEGGQGWLQLVELDDDNGRINVTTYSPSLDKFETDADSQFSFPVDFDARLGPATKGPKDQESRKP